MKHKVILVLLDGLNYEVARHALGHLLLNELLLAKQAFANYIIRIQIAYGFVFLQLCVQDRLGGLRIVCFIVSMTAVPDQVDQKILLEAVTVLAGHPYDSQTCLWIVCVDADDWYVESFSQIA